MKTKILFFYLFFSMLDLCGQVITPLGTGLTMRGVVYDIVIDDDTNKKYVVGDISGVEGVKSTNVAIYENDTWLGIPDTSQMEGLIYCAEVYQGDLYIGGNFTISSTEEIYNLAKLEDGIWRSLGVEFMSGSIRDLTWYDDELYVTGDFRAINGIDNHGIMKYSDYKWKDSGLDSYLNAEGLFVSNDVLFAWGNGFTGTSDSSHTVSFLENGEWNTLPKIGSGPNTSVSTATIVYQDVLYTIVDNQLFEFDFDLNKWVVVSYIDTSNGENILFEYKGELCALIDDRMIYRLTDGQFELMDFQFELESDEQFIKAVMSDGEILYVGGDFQHWESKSMSLSMVEENSISSIGKVATLTTYRGSRNSSIGNSIVRYNDKFLVGGNFTFADGVFSPNIVYWDGNEFTPFEEPLPDGIGQLEVFEGDLYAMPNGFSWSDPSLVASKLIKFDGEKWVGITNANIGYDRIKIINEKLFFYDEYSNNSSDGGPYFLRNGEWHELKPYALDEGSPYNSYRYSNVESYNGGYLMGVDSDKLVFLASDTSTWKEIIKIDIYFDVLKTLNDRIFLVSIWPEIIYEIKDNSIKIVSEDDGAEYSLFFEMNDEIYFSAWNGAMYRQNVSNQFEYYNQLIIRDVEKIGENQYLAVMQSHAYYAGIEVKYFNKIGVLTFEDLEVAIQEDFSSICPENYIQYWPTTEHINLQYHWEFGGGIPATSMASNPMIKYKEPGSYTTKLMATNLDQDTVIVESGVIIKDCKIPDPIAHNHDNHWIMGYEYGPDQTVGIGGFDFTFPDSVISSRYMSIEEYGNGTIVMSDNDGDLQFYSNGISIFNMDNNPVPGSECFNSDPNYSLDRFIANQSLLALPALENDQLYYLLDLDPMSIEGNYYQFASNLSVTTIDMSKNNGKGEVMICNEVILSDTLLNSTMQATRHHNGKDWWIIVGKNNSDEYYKMLLTEHGIEEIETYSWNRFYDYSFSGQSTFSPDGNYFAQVIREDQEVVLWKFDNTTGELYDQQVYTIATIDEYEFPQGCSFSPDSRFLYVSSRTQIRQMDLCDYDDLDVLLIDDWDGTYEFIYPLLFGKQMLNPHQQIIVAPVGNGHRSYGLIENPNEKGLNCNFKQHYLKLDEKTRSNADILPIFPHYRNYPSYKGECNTVDSENVEEKSTFMIYPNPLGSTNHLRFSEKVSGVLYDINGRLIYTFSNSDYLDIISLKAGMYFIKTNAGTRKFIKL